MTDTLDPLGASERISSDYLRYLRSAFSPSDPILRSDFDRQLADGRQLTRGPILQASPAYAKGSSVEELVAAGVLDATVGRLADAGFDSQRPLYVHQEQAIRKAAAGRNLIVATGTGSGKTESFLLPILDRLAGEVSGGTIAQAGVRALLLYPMNALANDQLARLRELLAPFPEITFGRYVGDTEQTLQKGVDQYRLRFGGKPPTNELVCREDMQRRPPHILITNFAMLEYLLLRPDDSSFFDGPTGEHWRQLVLDEIHVYDGAKGAEIGMLLRRLKDRVVRSEGGRLQCIGTSATLSKSAEDLPRLVQFASEVFDERFEFVSGEPAQQDIVTATHEEVGARSATWSAPPESFTLTRDRFRSDSPPADVTQAFVDAGAPVRAEGEVLPGWLGRVLAAESHVLRLQGLLLDGSVDLGAAAEHVLGESGSEEALVALVDLCVGAEVESAAPLLPARWHFLLRALEGAFVCLAPDHPGEEPRLLLDRHQTCPACVEQGRTSVMFELAVCRRCGARYIVGEQDLSNGLNILSPPRMVSENPRSFLVVEQLAEVLEDEDETALSEEIGGQHAPAVICTRCGAFGQTMTGCGCGAPTVALAEIHPAQPGSPIRACVACDGRTSGGSIILRFLTGSDAPVAVIATSLYQELPPVPDGSGMIGGGRKLLSFADSRQDAAFFAPYLERTYNRAVQRRLLWSVLADAVADGDTAVSIGDLRVDLKNRAIAEGLVDEHDEDLSPDRQARHWIYAEILSTDRQQNLEGVGLAEISPMLPRGLVAPRPLLDLGLTEEEVFDLARVLLDSVRRSRAVTVDSKVDLDDPIFEGRPTTGLRGDQSARGVISWNPSRGTNQRVKYLAKVLERLGRDPGEAAALLALIWDNWLGDPNGPWSELLVAEDAGGGKGVVRRLKTERLEFRPVASDHQPLQCSSCRQVWWRAVRGACPGVNCQGDVAPVDVPVGREHYRELYTDLSLIGLRVEEHTAQLSTDVAARRQQEFIDGKINVLSCSTTFELGVDVGEIQAVLMRNVPPSAANYVQRAGRAGRRAGSPALVVTFAQRRSHDLHFFAEPHSMVDGHVTPPVVNIENPAIVRRHLNALAFAEFQRQEVREGRSEARKVDTFFLPAGKAPSDRMMSWLHSHPDEVGAAADRIVPASVSNDPTVGLSAWSWLDGLDGDPAAGGGRLAVARLETRSELDDLDEQIDHAYAERRAGVAKMLESVRRTVANVRLIDRLARTGVLPKYGFPVDVVQLDLRGETAIELDRDLSIAIADFAPGNEIVADKRLWVSQGLKVESGLTLLAHRWTTCRTCQARWTWLEELENPPPCPSCGADAPANGERIIQPRFGFVGADTGKRPGDARPPRRAFTSSFFDDFHGDAPRHDQVTIGKGTIDVLSSRTGRVTVVNQGPGGRGYQICRWCGFMALAGDAVAAEHLRPRGRGMCTGKPVRAHLGHWYLTDTIQIRPGFAMGELEGLSTLHALLGATGAIGIQQSDMNGAIHPIGPGSWSLVLFDSVPGGAGHARRVRDELPALFEAAADRIQRCTCGEETSCYGCLRSYRNQSDHDKLQRRLAMRVFDAIVT